MYVSLRNTTGIFLFISSIITSNHKITKIDSTIFEVNINKSIHFAEFHYINLTESTHRHSTRKQTDSPIDALAA